MSPRSPLPIEWTESAWENLDGIIGYLLGESLPFDAVEDYIKRIYKAPEHLATLPGAGKPGRVPNTNVSSFRVNGLKKLAYIYLAHQ